MFHPVSKFHLGFLYKNNATSSFDSAIDSYAETFTTNSSHDLSVTSKTSLDVIPLKVKNNGKFVCIYVQNIGSERRFCELRIVDEMDLCNSHVKLAIQTLSTNDPHAFDTIAVSFSISSSDDSFLINLANVVVVDSILLAPIIISNLSDMQSH